MALIDALNTGFQTLPRHYGREKRKRNANRKGATETKSKKKNEGKKKERKKTETKKRLHQINVTMRDLIKNATLKVTFNKNHKPRKSLCNYTFHAQQEISRIIASRKENGAYEMQTLNHSTWAHKG
jgi:hypothetical protein